MKKSIGLLFLIFSALIVAACVAETPGNNQDIAFPTGETKSDLAPQPTQEEESDVIPTTPISCKPYIGFDNYRTEQSFAINPKNSREMYVTIEYKGVFKSTDGGATWELLGKGIKAWPRADNPKLPCPNLHFSIFIDSSNPNRILLPGGASPGRISNPMYQTGGLHESLDGGKSWHQLFNGEMSAYTGHVVTDPRNPEIIYVDTAALPASNTEADPNEIFVTKGIIYKTTDGGKSWEELPTGIVKDMRSTGLFLNPANPDNLLMATMGLPTGTNTDKKPSTEQAGILQTIDGGKTWAKLQSTQGIAIRSADVSAKNFGHIILFGDRNGMETKLYSLDGKTFNEAQTPVNFARFDPNDAQGLRLLGFSLYTQPDDIFESLDGGKTWNPTGKLPEEVTNDYRASNIVFDPSGKGTVYMNGDMGRVWKSTDSGRTWELLLSVEKLK